MKLSIGLVGFIAALSSTAPAPAATQSVNLQLVSLCEGAPVCAAPSVDLGYLQATFSQINIVVNVMSTIVDNTLSLLRNIDGKIISRETGVTGQLTGGALFQFTESFSIGIDPFFSYDIDPNTIYMGVTGDLLEPTLGVAFVDAPTLPFGIVENTAALQGGGAAAMRFSAAILAREIGHVLGGKHEAAISASNLLRASLNPSSFADEDYLPDFSAVNAAEIQASELLFLTPITAVPLPAALPALMAGLALLAGVRGRRLAQPCAPPSASKPKASASNS